MINVAVIGLGHNGMAFCERYMKNDRCELIGVYDINAERQAHAVSKFGVKGYGRGEVYEDKSLGLISIHTPDNSHKEPFIKAVESGFNVFVEKPMADNENDLYEMAKCASARDKVYAVGHVLRFDAYFRFVKKLIDMDTLGEIFYAECDYIHDLRYQAEMEAWKLTDEIPVLGGGCHPIDILRWYIGDIHEVSSFSNDIAFKEMSHDSSMVSILKFKSGCIGKVTSLYGVAAPRPDMFNLSVYGTKGSVVRNRISFDGMGESWMEIPVGFDKGHDYMPEIDHVLDCIIQKKPALVTPAEAYHTSMAGLYAEKSAKENRNLVLPGFNP